MGAQRKEGEKNMRMCIQGKESEKSDRKSKANTNLPYYLMSVLHPRNLMKRSPASTSNNDTTTTKEIKKKKERNTTLSSGLVFLSSDRSCILHQLLIELKPKYTVTHNVTR